MKIHKLVIENIASLRGKHTINFDNILIESPLFAITGDTGSGKSSILNCISLALYGKHYKKNIVHYDMVTLGERVGRVELYFSVRSLEYKAIFESTIRKVNGEFLKKPKSLREFYELRDGEEKILDLNPEDIIKLDYDQFSKTIILNQGMFAEFLMSDFKERKDIISKLYSNEYLESLNPMLRLKINEQIKKQDQLKAKHDGINSTQSERVEEDDLRELKSEVQIKQRNHQALISVQKIMDELDALRKQYNSSKEKLALSEGQIKDIIQEHNNAKEQQQKLTDAHKSLSKEYEEKYPQLVKSLEKSKQVEQFNKEIKTIQDKVKTDQEKQKAIKDELNTLEASHQIAQEKLKSISINPKLNATEIENYQSTIELLNQKIIKRDHLQKSIKDLDFEKKQYAEKRDKDQAQLDQIELQINQAKDVIEEKYKNHNEYDHLISQYEALQSEYQFLDKEIKNLSSQDQQNNTLLAKYQKNITEINDEVKNKEKSLLSLDKIIKQNELNHALNICHSKSQEDGECVVCGSPYASEISITEQDIANVQNEYNTLKEKLQGLDVEKNVLLTKVKEVNKNIIQNKERIQQINSDFNIQLNAVTKTTRRLSEKVDFTQKISELKTLRKEHLQISSELIQLKEKKSSFQELVKHTTAKLKELELKLSQLSKELTSLLAEIEKLSISLPLPAQELKVEITKFLQKEKAIREVEKLNYQIENKNINAKHIKDQINELLLSKAKFEQEVVSLKAEIYQLTNNLDPNAEINRLKNELSELSKKLENFTQEIKTLNDDKVNLQSKIQMYQDQLFDCEKLYESNVIKFNDITLPHPWKEFGLNQLHINTHELIFKTLMIKVQNSNDMLKADLEALKSKLNRAQVIYEQQLNKEKELKAIQKELKKIESDLNQWEELYQLIGKDEFRNFILTIVEKNLIKQTNYELQKICDARYQIEQISKAKSMSEFYVIDHFNGNELRKVSTLSGGETFMVSLAMSLALSEMTKGEAEIESFFIDEGFGTLDQDSLEEVYTMLNEINQRGKQIGLISHVKQLTDRIPVNVHLNKNRLGNSSVSIVLN